jgi:hypothetical protein
MKAEGAFPSFLPSYLLTFNLFWQVNVGRGDIAISIFLNFAGLFNKGGTALIHGPKAHIFFFPSSFHTGHATQKSTHSGKTTWPSQ